MKKTLSLLLSLFLLFSLSATAFAEEEAEEYNWKYARDRIQVVFPGHGNIWSINEVEALMWLPDVFLYVDPAEADLDNDCIGMFVMENSEAYILLSYLEIEGVTLDSLFSYYSQNGHDARMVTVNGIPAILDRNMEANNLNLTYQTKDNMFFQIIFSPVSDSNYEMMYDFVIASIQPDIQDEPSAEPVVPTNPVSSLISK